MTELDTVGRNGEPARGSSRGHHRTRGRTRADARSLLDLTGLLEMAAISSSFQLIARGDEGGAALGEEPTTAVEASPASRAGTGGR